MTKYSAIRKKLEVECLLNGNVEDLAYFTHYLHNHENGVSKSYEERAKLYFDHVNESQNIVSEPDIQ